MIFIWDDRLNKINMGVDDSQGTRGSWVLIRNLASSGGRSSDGKFPSYVYEKIGPDYLSLSRSKDREVKLLFSQRMMQEGQNSI